MPRTPEEEQAARDVAERAERGRELIRQAEAERARRAAQENKPSK